MENKFGERHTDTEIHRDIEGNTEEKQVESDN
jgi:hypothetical protein